MNTYQFIRKMHKILDDFESSLTSLNKSKEEVRALIMQFEEYHKTLEK